MKSMSSLGRCHQLRTARYGRSVAVKLAQFVVWAWGIATSITRHIKIIDMPASVAGILVPEQRSSPHLRLKLPRGAGKRKAKHMCRQELCLLHHLKAGRQTIYRKFCLSKKVLLIILAYQT